MRALLIFLLPPGVMIVVLLVLRNSYGQLILPAKATQEATWKDVAFVLTCFALTVACYVETWRIWKRKPLGWIWKRKPFGWIAFVGYLLMAIFFAGLNDDDTDVATGIVWHSFALLWLLLFLAAVVAWVR